MGTRLFAVVLLVFGLIACGDDAPQPPTGPSFTGPPKSLEITGDLTFTYAGQSRQLTATATFASGAARNVTADATWVSSNPSVATVAAGLVKVVSGGETRITASYRNVTSAEAKVSVAVNAALSSITIEGPAEMTPGSTAQFTAMGRYTDGSTKDITSSVTWRSTNVTVLRHVEAGKYEALKAGETLAIAGLTNRSYSKTVLILPAGTFKLAGTVNDQGGPVDGAEIEVVSGAPSGLKTTSRLDGGYALYGVSGAVRLRVSAAGYSTEELDTTVTSHTVRDFNLKTSSPIVDITGDWKLTASTSSACSSSWPSALRQREVGVRITQNSTRFTVRFNGPTFQATEGYGRIAGSVFSMTLYADFYYYYGFSGWIERISPTEWLRVTGTFESPDASSTLIAGNLNGTFTYTAGTAGALYPTGPSSQCAADGRFEFRR